MPSFYCCSLNCWFFFSTGIAKGILFLFILGFLPFTVFVLIPALLTQLFRSCSWLSLSFLLCNPSRLRRYPWNTGIRRKFLLSVTSAYDGRDMKMEMEEARDFFSSSVSTLLLWLEDRSLWVDDTWWEGNIIHTAATCEYQWLKNWPCISSFTCFSLRNREHFPICFSHDFRASIEWRLVLCLSQCSEGGEELFGLPAQKACFYWIVFVYKERSRHICVVDTHCLL